MLKSTTAGILVFILYLAISVFTVTGYVKNIIKLTKCDFKPSYKTEIVRSAGIIIPVVGVITGYMALPDGEHQLRKMGNN